LCGDGSQSPVEAVQCAADLFVADLAPVHFQQVAGGGEGLTDAGRIRADR
jgi:hypothetical protein